MPMLTLLLICLVLASVSAAIHRNHYRPVFGRPQLSKLKETSSSAARRVLTSLRGGDEEERYSRQVYTLGQRAHGLIRSATIYLDGPLSSGLLYECAKNLALSGIGNLVILKQTANSDLDVKYHYEDYDDLGKSYQRAARAELGVDENDVDDASLLQMFLQRLNPSVHVSVEERTDSFEGVEDGVLLSVDRPHSTQLSLNAWCRSSGMKFISIETAGLYGKTFCDFGPDFQVYDSDGETPSNVPVDKLQVLEDEDSSTLQIDCVEGERHDVSRGDVIEFHLGTGDTVEDSACEVLQVKSPTKLILRYKGDKPITDFCTDLNTNAATFRRLKIPEAVEFSPLDATIAKAYTDDSLFAICDLDKSFDPVRKSALLSSFQALATFIKEKETYPTAESGETFVAMAETTNKEQLSDSSSWRDIVQSFARTCKGKLTPVQAVLGAIGAQEALKAASGLYNPIRQFLLFDCDEVIDDDSENTPPSETACTGQAYVLGTDICETLSNSRLFVVGAGAIGCELLKNLASMGARRLIVTDMDTIEHSNLSRQLLFRDSDIGSFKSVAAKNGIARFNPDVETEVHTSKVGEGENGPFGNKFWSKKVDVVLNALDNVDARLYVDSQCVAYQKALIDAGTLGSKGNVQVIVPFQSESYGSSVDPPEPAIPVCTLKNFPYLISHTIQWGRDLFDGLFTKRPEQVNELKDLLREKGEEYVVRQLVSELGQDAAKEAATALLEDLRSSQSLEVSGVRESAIEWAAQLATQMFRDSIESLLLEHPVDSVDEDDEPFWSGSRRAPTPVTFQAGDLVNSHQEKANANLVSFVQTCARLRMEALLPGLRESGDSGVSRDLVESSLLGDSSCVESKDVSVEMLIKESYDLVNASSNLWVQTDFEKDDDSNGHVEFVAAASNLRAICYGIAPVDAMETRRVAGQIVPAMITTTALVSALSCVELLKLVQTASLKRHRNAFINLALPFFAFTQPVPAETIEGVGEKSFTLWDRTVVKEGKKSASRGGMKLTKVLSRILKKAGLDDDVFQVSTVSYGPYMLYASFMHEDDDDHMKKSIWALIADAFVSDEEYAGRDGPTVSASDQLASLHGKAFVDLSVMVEETETGLEFEIPPVRIVRSSHVKKP